MPTKVKYVWSEERHRKRDGHWICLGDYGTTAHNEREGFIVMGDQSYTWPSNLPLDFHRSIRDYIGGTEEKPRYKVVYVDADPGSKFAEYIASGEAPLSRSVLYEKPQTPLTEEEKKQRFEREQRRKTLAKLRRNDWDRCKTFGIKGDPRHSASSYSLRNMYERG